MKIIVTLQGCKIRVIEFSPIKSKGRAWQSIQTSDNLDFHFLGIKRILNYWAATSLDFIASFSVAARLNRLRR
jgi:hypothetical protein